MRQPVFACAATAVAGFLTGLCVHSNFYVNDPFPVQPPSIFYQSEIGSDLALKIDSKGKMTFGPEYDRDAEVKKFIDVFRQMYLHEKSLPCAPVAYRPPVGGIVTIRPGTAWPPPVIFEQHG